MEVVEYTISKHAKERYAERIMGKDSDYDANRFILTNEDKIKTDINKLITYGELIYTGKLAPKDGKSDIVDVYLKDCWIVLANSRTKNVITLYKIDLGLDDEFNKSYVSKMMDKMNERKDNLNSVQQQVQDESNTYRELINDAENQIKEYRVMIKNLEELCVGYKTIIDNNCIRITQANRDVVDVLNTLIGKKEF